MSSIIVVFPKIEDGKKIRTILVRHGFDVNAVCTNGSQGLHEAHDLHGGVLICGYKLPDMLYTQLREYLPAQFEMLLIASERMIGEKEQDDVTAVATPIRTEELIFTVQSMCIQADRRLRRVKSKPELRNEKQKETIQSAKQLLMEKNRLSEEEAHRYLQKCSMDSGTNMVETAEMVITLMSS